jgi:hypothetical protein
VLADEATGCGSCVPGFGPSAGKGGFGGAGAIFRVQLAVCRSIVAAGSTRQGLSGIGCGSP